jgi:hypothetical protein
MIMTVPGFVCLGEDSPAAFIPALVGATWRITMRGNGGRIEQP